MAPCRSPVHTNALPLLPLWFVFLNSPPFRQELSIRASKLGIPIKPLNPTYLLAQPHSQNITIV